MKPARFVQLYVHLVISPRHRQSLITPKVEGFLFPYINGILGGLKHKPMHINGMPDHIHVLFGLNPDVTISDTVREIKRSSTQKLNEKRIPLQHFSWQDGYGAFTVGHTQLDVVYQYIDKQKEHHRTTSFREEYTGLLTENEIPYNTDFLFQT